MQSNLAQRCLSQLMPKCMMLFAAMIALVACSNVDNSKIFEYPMYQNYPKLQNFIWRAGENPMAVAVSPPFCPHYSYTIWNRPNNRKYAIDKCDAVMAKGMSDFPPSEVARCKCRPAIVDRIVLDESLLSKQMRWVSMIVYRENRDGSAWLEQGYLEMPHGSLRVTKVRFLNLNLQTVCQGEFRLPTHKMGAFRFTCNAGQEIMTGTARRKGNDLKFYTHATGTDNTGHKAAFVIGLKRREFESRHPQIFE